MPLNRLTPHYHLMLFRLFAKLTWFVTKLAAKYVVIPILISAAVGAVLGFFSEKVREGTPEAHDGKVDPLIRPER